jgi:hypothetical protein
MVLHSLQIGLQIGLLVSSLWRYSGSTPFRHGKGDNFGLRVCPFVNQRLQPGLPRQQFLNRGDLFIFALPFRADGFQNVAPPCAASASTTCSASLTNIARRDVPALIAGIRTMQIPRLMRAMKRTQTDVKPCELIVHVLISLS